MSLVSNRLARGRIHYGWYVAGITFVTLLVAAGIRSMPSILIVPVEQEFGWSRATISFAVASHPCAGFSAPGSSSAS